MTAPATFEIGLVCAGAISAGCYTAGVIDFLIEALDAWEDARTLPDYDGPTHDVRIKVLSGASAGGITAGIAAIALNSQTKPVHDVDLPPTPALNRLYDAWVKRIDIRNLLGTADLDGNDKVVSVLDSTELRSIAADALKTAIRQEPRRYVSDPLPVFLTVSNLRGVPYEFELAGSSTNRAYGMLAHADYMGFAITRQDALSPEYAELVKLNPAELPGPQERPIDKLPQPWWLLARSALASGAFPIGLQARDLSRAYADYKTRFKQEPRFPEDFKDPYQFLCVDGGLMNNEPLELARKTLARGDRNPRSGELAHRAVVMIDPFPNRLDFPADWQKKDRVVDVVQSMFAALIGQARFKPEELELAADPNVYSRFVISPSRSTRPGEPAMASAVLGGFGGFLSEGYRKHDFQLGRRNCQNFLRWRFAIPETNEHFAPHWPESARRKYRVDSRNPEIDFFDSSGARMLPVIPLMERVKAEIPLRAAPKATEVDLDAIGKMIKTRTKRVGSTLIDTDLKDVLGGTAFRWMAKQALAWKIAPRVRDVALRKLNDQLKPLR